MATSDIQQQAGHSEALTFGRACEAHDLKRILSTIADQIADADKRHSEALGVMQQRLASLGVEAKAVRERAPEEMIPALERIEDRMTALSDKMVSMDEGNLHLPSGPTPASELAVAPAALRSALTTDRLGSFTRREESARAAVNPAADRFDVVSFDGSVQEDNVWDTASAEALTRIYERGDAGLATDDDANHRSAITAERMPTHPAPLPAELAPAPTFNVQAVHDDAAMQIGSTPAHLPSVLATPASSALDQNQQWLEQRFIDVAAKIEQSLAGLRPDGSMTELSTRFSALEERIGAVMGETVTRADLSSLSSIEAQVEDLTARLDTVQTHFARLDTIELELRALADHINEDNLTRLFQRSAARNVEPDAASALVAARMPHIETALQSIAERLSQGMANTSHGATPPDADTMAAIVAAKIAEQMAHSREDHSGSVERIDDLRVLLNGFIDEQRHGDEQTNTMLDTMQQAMIRLLDRMDSIETGTPMPSSPALPPRESFVDNLGADRASLARTEASAQLRHDDEQLPAFGRRPDAHHEERGQSFPTSLRPDHAETHAEGGDDDARFRNALTAETPVASRRDSGQAKGQTENDGAADGVAASREDFIAAARRAARQVTKTQSESDDSIDAAPASTVKAMPKPRAAKPPVPPAAAVAGVEGVVAKRRSWQPSMLSIGLFCLITVSVSFMVAKPFLESSNKMVIDANQPISGAAKPTSGAQSKPESNDGDEVIAPAPSKRGSLNGATVVGDVAGAFSGLVPTSLSSEPMAGSIDGGVAGRIEEGGAASKAVGEMPPASIGPNSLRVAAAKGDPSAEFEIGARFAEGKGVQQDLKQAVAWYQRSAAQGFAAAQYRLASMFERGLGAKLDIGKATIWYQRAAEQGNVKAMHNLAVMRAGREGVAADYATAQRWFSMAADHGLADSQFNLAIMHESGLGMEKNPRLAYKWFALAARAGDAEASRRRDVVRGKLLPAELREVDAEIEAWRPKSADVTVNDVRVAGEAWKQRAQ